METANVIVGKISRDYVAVSPVKSRRCIITLSSLFSAIEYLQDWQEVFSDLAILLPSGLSIDAFCVHCSGRCLSDEKHVIVE